MSNHNRYAIRQPAHTPYIRGAAAYNYARPAEVQTTVRRAPVVRPVPPRPKPRPRPVPAGPRKKTVKRKKQTVYSKAPDKSVRINAAFYFFVVVIFIGLMSLILVNAAYYKKWRETQQLTAQVKTLREANQDTRALLMSSYDENAVLQRAHEMGMAKPRPYQIIYINVPRESFAQGGGAEASVVVTQTKRAQSLFEGLLEYIGIGSGL